MTNANQVKKDYNFQENIVFNVINVKGYEGNN